VFHRHRCSYGFVGITDRIEFPGNYSTYVALRKPALPTVSEATGTLRKERVTAPPTTQALTYERIELGGIMDDVLFGPLVRLDSVRAAQPGPGAAEVSFRSDERE
jgi:hypothetical protein